MNEFLSTGVLAMCLGCISSSGAPDYSGRPISVYVTAKDTGQRLAKAGELQLRELSRPIEEEQAVYVDPDHTFQRVLGIGGALTDGSAETFYKLPKARQEEFLKAYFDPQSGIGYSLGRTSIHSCDFSSDSYTYVQEGDKDLKSFDVAHDLKCRIPFIKAALAIAGKDFTMYASPWSPPAWMKSNGDMLHGGKLKPEYGDAWANYFCKFIEAYERQGIPIWGVSVQNEPMAVQTWESCIYTAGEERDFLKNHLGPALRKAGLKDKKIIIWDHNRSLMYQRAKEVLDDPEAAKYVWGVGFHWYMGDYFENVKRVHEAYPQVNLLFTEACNYPYDTLRTNDWQWAENYGKSMINDFNNGAVGWTDWNVLLDEQGGPNHVHNYCYAPVHGDTKSGEVYYLNSYYYIGHFSKFVRPGARRIIASSTMDQLLTTAFLNTDGKIAVVVMNLGEQAQPFCLWLAGKGAKATSPARSMMTLVL
ncbi:MAG TPA: glycoside hydrolase family 30 protein [Candidatus Acidoferrum sp.]|nr:glycoside hydrolase family 30 protein [Candidatus Acidoferrum sp.]